MSIELNWKPHWCCRPPLILQVGRRRKARLRVLRRGPHRLRPRHSSQDGILENQALTAGLLSLRLACFFGLAHNMPSSGSSADFGQGPAMHQQRKARLPRLRQTPARFARPACLVSTRMAWPTQRVQANDHLEWPAPAHASTACRRKNVQHAWRSVASGANVGPSKQRAAAAT